MNITLATIHLEPSTRAVPLAAACLKAMVKKHDVMLRNYYVQQSAEEIGHSIYTEKPEAVGFSVYLWNRNLVSRTIDILKQLDPDVVILAGGPEVTAKPDAFLKNTQTDIVMQGEGELTFAPILDAIADKKPIPEQLGIRTKHYIPEASSYCSDFDSLPSPLLSGALDLSENTGLLWELSRGCPFACDFCFESKGSGKIRAISLERVRKELELIREYDIEQVFVLDPTFNSNKNRVLEILALIREYTPQTYYYFEIRSEFVDEETAEAFASIPCTLQVGLQSGSPQVLKRVNRTLNPDKFREKMAVLSQFAVSFGLDLIYGLPGDTLEGFRNSLDYALSLEPNHLDLFPLALLPGTTLYDKGNALGLHAQDENPYGIIHTDGMTPSSIEAARILSEETDLLYNRGKAVSWFMSVCRDLSIKPSELVEQWSLFGKEEQIAEDLLQDTIILFLQGLYKERHKENEFRIVRDLIHYLGIQSFLEELQDTAETVVEAVLLEENTRIAWHPSMTLQAFVVPPPALLHYSADQSDAFAPYLSHEDDLWVFWSREWELCYERLDPPCGSILELLKKPARFSELPVPEERKEWLKDFILESILEGYLIIV